MILLRGYLGRALLRSTALVLAVLLALAGFIEFVGQLDDLGVGEYGVAQGMAYAAMKLPEMAFVMLPMAALLGGLLGLGALANGSEMIALRAAGVSPVAMARALLATAAALALFALALGTYLSPPVERYSRQFRTFAMHGPGALAGAESAWVRDGNVIMNLSRMGDPTSFGGVYLFRLGDDGQLASMARADSAEISEGLEWTLNSYAETRFTESGVAVRHERRFAESTGLNPQILGLSVVRPEALNALALWRYIAYLRVNGLEFHRFEVAFWSRIASAVAVAPMCVLALALVFGQMRRAGTGARMIVGILLGLGYFLFSRSLADGGRVFEINAVAVGWLPALLLVVVTVTVLLRAR
jgi:lipopolysaccharide export system permease protein